MKNAPETQLTYRLMREEDLPGLLRLWEEETGWGALTPETWRKWYTDTPHGDCLVVVAVDENDELAGQEVFTPALVVVDECEVRALRLSAPILRRDLRRARIRNMNHPVIGLYWAGVEAGAARGYQLVYALPEHAWLPFFRWLPRFADAEYACAACPLVPVAAGDLVATPIGEFGNEYEALWRSARKAFPIHCAVLRSPNWLRYKNRGHVALEVRDRRDNTLVGYTATRRKDGLVVDLLARNPDDLSGVLAATRCWMACPDNHAEFDRLKVMRLPVLSPALDALGFEPIDYQFAFVCDSIDPDLSPSAVAPARWYLSPGD